MEYGNYEFNVLVKDKKIHEYKHKDNIFVEGRRNSNFELEFKNNSYSTVLIVPSVDGLNTLDGKQATPRSNGYLVKPSSSIKIPGWTLDANNVAKFVFQDKERSYAKSTSPSGSTNTGVLGILVFNEDLPYPLTAPSIYQPTWPTYDQAIRNAGNISPNSMLYNSTGIAPVHAGAIVANVSLSSASISTSATSATAPRQESFTLGTGFGEKDKFSTTEVMFKRGRQTAELLIYYDDRKGLSARGIEFTKRPVNDLPKAFHTGCKPPPGWRG